MSKFDHPYNPKEVEEKIYMLWEKSGFFDPDNLTQINADQNPAAEQARYGAGADKRGSARIKRIRENQRGNPRKSAFCIIMPPPNASGSLHIGNAMFVVLEDLMIRYHRMKGDKTLWLPGIDHAGFEAQVVFNKELEKQKRNVFEIPRDQLYKEMWDFAQANKINVEDQLRRLGASCDWSREKFTLDPDIVEIVNETFRKLYKDGLAYRDLRVINWCTKHQTALSDLEVKYVEREDSLYYIKYGPLTLATVRPETKFGDTALAVNPKDKRYQKYIGKEIEANGLLGPLKFKVIADNAVDPKFGTGVVKVTPAHDLADFEIWQRHKDEIPGPKIVIDERGRLTSAAGPYAGVKIAEAREKIAQNMKEIGILEKIEPYTHQVATCYKCGTTLEPLPRMQWFVAMTKKPETWNMKHESRKISNKSLRDMAVDAVEKGEIKFVTKKFEKIFLHWMKNLRDWNISRQIVWGIRIPAWYCMACGDTKINPEIKSNWFLVRHGETDFNKEDRFNLPDTPLNEKGRAQAMDAARQLEGKNIDLIISSDFRRTKETAEIIAKHLKCEVIFDEGLREADSGDWRGMTREEILSKHFPEKNEWDSSLRYKFKQVGGEDFEDLEKRAWQAFQNHRSNHSHKNIVIVTHGGVIRALRAMLKKISFADSFDRFKPVNNAEIIPVSISEKKCSGCDGDIFEQDPDVFDTWFSSGQWPFATLLASSRSKLKIKDKKSKIADDFETFYPTSVMETGWDILFFWVARMIMLGIYRTGKIPFKTIYLHGLVRDKDRQKMSKSKGNVIDPLGISEIYGADALRMALITSGAAGTDPVISEDKIRGYRNFATKLWNITRFILMNYDAKNVEVKPKYTPKDKKILAELKTIKTKITKEIDSYRFHEAASTIYQYIWHTFADKILESSKPRLTSENPLERKAAQALNMEILIACLKLLHPFMPFVTEEIYQNLPKKNKKVLMVEQW